MDYIEAKQLFTPKSRKSGKGRKILVQDGDALEALNDYKATLAEHRAQIKQLKTDIRAHKLLMKQARTAYKLGKIIKRNR